MYFFGESELAEVIDRMRQDQSRYLWFWYRDVILQAQDRGFLKVVGHSQDMPFWWRKFEESIELFPKILELIERNRQRDSHC